MIKNHSSYLLLVILFFTVCSCITESNDKEDKEKYNFSILYDFSSADSTRQDKYRYKYSADTLYLFIEESFKKDVVKIYLNGKSYKQLSATSDLSIGLADLVKIGNIKDIDNVGIAINNSPVVSFELFDSRMNLVGIDKRGKKVEVCFYKKVPLFY